MKFERILLRSRLWNNNHIQCFSSFDYIIDIKNKTAECLENSQIFFYKAVKKWTLQDTKSIKFIVNPVVIGWW